MFEKIITKLKLDPLKFAAGIVALLSLAFVVGVMTGCSPSTVSFDTLEEAKSTARDNALFNAQKFRAENPDVKDYSAVSNGDSSQTASCPQGDGWASLKLFSPDASKTIALKCSTVSGATGCLRDAEFKSKPFAAEDGHCQPTTALPFPLKRIAK